MRTASHRLETTFIIVLAAIAGAFFATYVNNYKPKSYAISEIPFLNEAQLETATITPSPKTEVISQISSDGNTKVIMRTVDNNDGTQTHTFSVADGVGNNQKIVFSKTLDNAKTIIVPFNTLSPDNKYFFIQEHVKDKNTVTNAYVFKTSGDLFATEEKYLDATDLFNKRNTGNSFTEATGWASETLIIINTTTEDNIKGPSYWFEVPSKAIIQLSTEF